MNKWYEEICIAVQKLTNKPIIEVFKSHNWVNVTIHLNTPLRTWGSTLSLAISENRVELNNLREFSGTEELGDMAALYFLEDSISNADFIRIEW